jgi:hypothetical protein
MGETAQEFYDRRESNAKLSYERRLVRKLISRLGIKVIVSPAEGADATCVWFRYQYPTFPVLLMTSAANNTLDAWRWFAPWTNKNPFCRYWNDVCEVFSSELESGRFAGTMFVSQNEGMVLHNYKGSWAKNWRCFQGFIDGYPLIVEPLTVFATRMATIWTP